MLNTRLNSAINHGCNLNDGDILYSELQIVLHREISSNATVYCFGHKKTYFISGLINRTVIDITQLGCPELAEVSVPNISCTFACHKSRHVSALRTAYTLAYWLNFYILSLQYVMCQPQPGFH
jgi:hypothetical protein